jgi:hypothetical protein
MLKEYARPQVATEARAGEQSGTYPLPAYSISGRRVGTWAQDTGGCVWLVKRNLDPDRHMLRTPRGWATDASHISEMARRRAWGVRLHLLSGEVWTAGLRDFEQYGVPIERGGCGAQVVLPERYWTRTTGQAGLFDGPEAT